MGLFRWLDRLALEVLAQRTETAPPAPPRYLPEPPLVRPTLLSTPDYGLVDPARVASLAQLRLHARWLPPVD